MDLVKLILNQAISLYQLIIFVYVIVTWFPNWSVTHAIRNAFAPIVEPFLALFRRAIPAVSGVDFSPIIAILVLRILSSFISRLL